MPIRYVDYLMKQVESARDVEENHSVGKSEMLLGRRGDVWASAHKISDAPSALFWTG